MGLKVYYEEARFKKLQTWKKGLYDTSHKHHHGQFPLGNGLWLFIKKL
jgi:hypothetical protein